MELSIDFIKQLKQRILASRYVVAKMANSEFLKLYYTIGSDIDREIANSNWGDKILEAVSARLQQELPGLRGFSASNLKKMRIFFNAWKPVKEIGSSLMNPLENKENEIGSSLTNEFKNKNFQQSLPDTLSNKAMRAFKDQYLLDFVNVEDADDDMDERVLEKEIVLNIKKFLMTLGTGFTFVGNQYRIKIAEDEYFIDLLFYHRGLQALVAFELKTGKFKPEYIGKMNFYLSALDDLVKQPHENASIGIILCKEKNDKKVEYSFRDFSKPLGVATYRTSETLPPELQKALPDAETLKKWME